MIWVNPTCLAKIIITIDKTWHSLSDVLNLKYLLFIPPLKYCKIPKLQDNVPYCSFFYNPTLLLFNDMFCKSCNEGNIVDYQR